MPWTAKDAHRFKKGLTPDQAKKWAKIANAVLESCMADRGDREACERIAIATASSRVGRRRTRKGG